MSKISFESEGILYNINIIRNGSILRYVGTPNKLTDNALKILFDKLTNHQDGNAIRAIVLDNNDITDEGFETLLKFIENHEVKHISLGNNNFTKASFDKLSAILPKVSLTSINKVDKAVSPAKVWSFFRDLHDNNILLNDYGTESSFTSSEHSELSVYMNKMKSKFLAICSDIQKGELSNKYVSYFDNNAARIFTHLGITESNVDEFAANFKNAYVSNFFKNIGVCKNLAKEDESIDNGLFSLPNEILHMIAGYFTPVEMALIASGNAGNADLIGQDSVNQDDSGDMIN